MTPHHATHHQRKEWHLYEMGHPQAKCHACPNNGGRETELGCTVANPAECQRVKEIEGH